MCIVSILGGGDGGLSICVYMYVLSLVSPDKTSCCINTLIIIIICHHIDLISVMCISITESDEACSADEDLSLVKVS